MAPRRTPEVVLEEDIPINATTVAAAMTSFTRANVTPGRSLKLTCRSIDIRLSRANEFEQICVIRPQQIDLLPAIAPEQANGQTSTAAPDYTPQATRGLPAQQSFHRIVAHEDIVVRREGLTSLPAGPWSLAGS